MNLSTAHFVKARRSGSDTQQACVECTFDFAAHGVVGVRDSKDSTGPVLVFPSVDWTSFLGAARAGTLS